MKTITTNENETTRRPRLAFYNANGKNSGAAAIFEVIPARPEEEGCVQLKLAKQLGYDYPRFDWTDSIVLKLDFADIGKILQVLRGVSESVDDGKGFFCATSKATAVLRFRHVIEPRPGYELECIRTIKETGKETRILGRLEIHEAESLLCALEGSMTAIAFGLPNYSN